MIALLTLTYWQSALFSIPVLATAGAGIGATVVLLSRRRR